MISLLELSKSSSREMRNQGDRQMKLEKIELMKREREREREQKLISNDSQVRMLT